jgi:hypothetical protein
MLLEPKTPWGWALRRERRIIFWRKIICKNGQQLKKMTFG